MSSDAIILDGYVDEPTCLGVPPYISPYVRYIAGVLKEHGFTPEYHTIDRVRGEPALLQGFRDAKVLVMIAGVTVPGRYLGGTPATLTEVQQVGATVRGPLTIICGPILLGYAGQGGRKAVRRAITGFREALNGPPAEALDSLLSGGEPVGEGDYGKIDRWSVLGAPIVRQHPSFPHAVIELETATGCPRSAAGGCSFCTERFRGEPRYREPAGVEAEVEALYATGARHFRMGRQPDLLVYGASGGEYPAPVPEKLERLFAGVRRAAPGLKTLHIDNVNPATIARHPEEAERALEAIVRHHTPGDVAALGMETADPVVIRENNLKAAPDEVSCAIRVINRVGGRREDGIPHLLPGLNFVTGLKGETPRTYELNRGFLEGILRSGLLVRRVNIRQVMPFEGTPAYAENTLGRYANEFRRFREWVRREFDLPMLRRVFPIGTVLRGVVIEQEGPLSLGRQPASYPILVGLPLRMGRGEVTDAVVVDHGMRSVTALPVPVEVNRLPPGALAWLPGVGRRRALSIAARRPFAGIGEFREVAGETGIEEHLSFH